MIVYPKVEKKLEAERQAELREQGVPMHVFPTKHGKRNNSWQARRRLVNSLRRRSR